MNRKLVATLTLLTLMGCSQSNTPSSNGTLAAEAQRGSQGQIAAPAFGLAAAGAVANTPYEARIRQQRSFADLPDRGELLVYDRDKGQRPRIDGAYTWHRVSVSEEHALRAIAAGHLRVLTPSGQALDIRYDSHVEHPSGDLSWIGHIEGQTGVQTILTFGADVVFGAIGQPGKRSLRLTTRNGEGWIVEADPNKLAASTSAGAHPRNPDALAVPKRKAISVDAAGVQSRAAPKVVAAAMAAGESTTIDVLVGYTPGFASANGGASGVMTRLNFLATVSNEALANSTVHARIRIVNSMQVNYTDNSTNESTLEQLTGYDSSSQQYTTPAPAFNALRAARESYGADLVTLLRDFREPEQDGCGIAWLIGGGQSGVSPGDGQDYFGYSVVGDGYDENGSETYYCRDESLVHELAHNMGSQHDREEAKGADGRLDPDDYGAFAYSFGYKTSAAAGNFYTIMAYGDEGQADYRVFSSPRLSTFCGGYACGTANDDNSLSLYELAPIIAGFRASNVGKARHDLDGNGASNLLYREYAGSTSYIRCSGQGGTCSSLGIGLSWRIMATGDFDGDRDVDFIWGADSTRALSLWTSNGVDIKTRYAMPSYAAGWSVIGAGDVDGDGKSDLLLRYPRTISNNFSYWIMDGYRRVRVGYQTLGASWRVAATGDFNADGKLDLVWVADSTRELAMWIGSGSGFAKYSIGSYGAGWRLVGAGDIDGDVKSDLIFRYYKSVPDNFSYWIMNGASRIRTGYAYMGASWRIGSTGDYNGDGKLDIQWAADSARYMWYGNGVSFAASSYASLPAGYEIIDL